MAEQTIRFEDGAAYERYMGRWSQLVGEVFLEWLRPGPALEWLDVGCGNGVFTEQVHESCAPASLAGIDPSQAQIAFARTRPALRAADFRIADAMDLPFPDDRFDVAVMPLVIFFVPDPARGVREMARVVRRGGLVAAYAWDFEGGGPYQPLMDAFGEMGIAIPRPPSPDASRMDVFRSLWEGAGLRSVETRVIAAERTFESFDDFWSTVLVGPSAKPVFESISTDAATALKERVRSRLKADDHGRITYAARANAIRGKVA